MARFDADFNADIQRTIKSFNQKVRRAERRGEKGLPELRTVKEFKAQFATKKDAKKELALLKNMLNNKQALQRRRTKEGTISNWEYDYIVKNLKDTKAWVDRELMKAQMRVKDYPEHLYAIREDVLKLEQEKAYLDRNIANLSSRELQTVEAIERRMKRSELKTITGRTYFMDTLDSLMQAQGLPKTERKKIADKLNALTNDEFLELYKTHDIVSTIMGYYIPSDKDGEVKMLEDLSRDDEVKEIMNNFTENLDAEIMDAKESTAKFDSLIQAGTGKKYSREDFIKYVKGGKW